MRFPDPARAITALALIPLISISLASHAQTWPARSGRILVPFTPGGGTDIQARLFAKRLTETTGQSFVVDNRGGAGGLIGAELIAKGPADGYNILFTTASLA